jgi:hypothetical protein
VAAAAEVEVQDVLIVVERVNRTIMTSLEHQKMDMPLKEEGLVAIKDNIDAVEIFEKIPLLVVMSMW